MATKIGFATWTLGDVSAFDYLPRLADMGYDGVEVVGDFQGLPLDDLRAALDESELSVFSVLAPPQLDLAHPLPSMRQESIDYLRDLIDFCIDVGSPRLVVREQPGRLRPIVGRTKEWGLLQQSLRTLGYGAAHAGIQVCLLPINRYEGFLVSHAQDALSLLEKVNSAQVKIALNSYHMNIEEEGFRSTFDNVSGQLGLFYAAENHRRALGQGRMDWLEICLTLGAIGYEGPILIECQAQGSDPLLPVGRAPDWDEEVLRYAEASLEHMRMVQAACERDA
jgi:D-psicose/D-tagatose/L-ribulose 3-epimerase